jgi:excisionase family DNA binding protein
VHEREEALGDLNGHGVSPTATDPLFSLKLVAPGDGCRSLSLVADVKNDEILTIPELAALLKIAEKTVYGLAQRREVPGFKVGGQWRFSRAAIDAWIETRTHAHQITGSASEQSGGEGASPDPRVKARRRRQ